MISTLAIRTAFKPNDVLAFDTMHAAFQPNQFMTFNELCAALSGFRIYVGRPAGRDWLAWRWDERKGRRVSAEGALPSDAVAGLLERIGGA